MNTVNNQSCVIERFFALDLDRTLIKTSLLAKDFISYVEGLDPGVAGNVKLMQQSTEDSGGSFDLLEGLSKAMDQSLSGLSQESLIDNFIKEYGGDKYLERGAEDLISRILDGGNSFGIITYGGYNWQLAKLKIIGFDYYNYLIISQKNHKLKLISEWWNQDLKLFVLPDEFKGVRSKGLSLVDDKWSELDSISEYPFIDGYLFTGGEKKPVARKNFSEYTMPANMTTVDSLKNIATI